MADQMHNLGAQVTVGVYVETSPGKLQRLIRDFSEVLQFTYEDKYYEGDDEYLGPGDVEPWQRPKQTEGTFSTNERNALAIEGVLNGLKQNELTGTRPNVMISRTTTNTDGTISKIQWKKCVLKGKFEAPGKGEKNKWMFTWRGVPPQTVE